MHLLVITDDLPDGDITAALHAIAELLPPERRRLLVVLDDDCSREALQACLDVQVAGLCRASAVGTGQVLSTMAAITHGGVSIDPWFLQRLQQPRHEERSSPLVWDADGLSRRERQLLRLTCEGYDSREISERVGISQNGVRRCLSNAYQRIGVRDRAQAIGWSVAHGVISARDLRRIYRCRSPRLRTCGR
jgi:DNA-binding NarL/FixJ family response regulator